MANLLLLFIVLPAVELYLLIRIGTLIGAGATVGLIIITGAIGAAMARSQGLRVISTVQTELAAGRLPAGPLLDGLMILLAAALLVTPGVLTDVFGFLCLTPIFRGVLKRELVRRFEAAVAENRIRVHVDGVKVHGDGANVHTESFSFDSVRDRDARPTIDVTPIRSESDEENG